MTLPDPLALVGTTVAEKYDIEAVVGEGGFAVVYRATHRVWQRAVAIKVFRALGDLPADRRDMLVKAFIQEGALLAELSERSAAICQARDVGMLRTHDGREMPYMVLEWLEGRSLEQVIEDEAAVRAPARTAGEALHILEPAALALALAHRKGIAHRDVKPANIFVLGDPRGDYTVKLLDFGIAKVVQDMRREAGDFQKTQGVVSSFTPAYGAPEQFSRTHGATGPWTDVFALGLIFTELMTQDAPLRGDDLTQLAFCSMDPERRPTPRTYGVAIPDALEAVLLRAVAVAPDERFRGAGELWDALRGALAMEPMRSFALTDSSRSLRGDGVLSALARESSPSISSSAAAAVPLLVPPPADLPRARSTFGLFAGLGAGVIALAGLLAGGVYVFALRGKDPVLATPIASAATPVASAPPPLTGPACPPGMILVKNGKFFMGSDDKADEANERPAHQVTLASFCIDRTEVTVAQYKACSDKGECKRAPRDNDWPGITARERKIYDPLCNARDPEGKATYPINCIDWELSGAYCAAQGGRLPTEAEWEFATRGSDGRRFPWGDDRPTGGHLNACGKECVAWGKKNNEEVTAMYAADDGFATTAPVGSFPAGSSPFGLVDVVGNVWEWASDWYAPYTDAAQTNPIGAATGTERVLRGGAWNGGDVAWVRPTYRFKTPPGLRSHGIGFRCAKDAK
ncbi:MAG: Serine/threonine kinase [Labilithrix sp.]|nr:Serine/threonine kinase [Labilithrix sp.]